MTRYEAHILKTITLHLKYYSSWIFVVDKSAEKNGFLKYLQINHKKSDVSIYYYFGLSNTPGPCSCHSRDTMNDSSRVAALLDDKSGNWIAYTMDVSEISGESKNF